MFKTKHAITIFLVIVFSSVFITGCENIDDSAIDNRSPLENLRQSKTTDTYCDSKISKKDKKQVYKLIKKLGIKKLKETDPQILKSILFEDMLLGDLASFQAILGDKLEKPQSLKPMIDTIAESIITKHPAIVEFISKAMEQGLISKADKETREVIKRVVHHTYLLDILTVEMVKDVDFMVEVNNHLIAKREVFGLSSDFMTFVLTMYHATGELFEPIKTKTMDWVFIVYEEVRNRGYMYPHEENARKQSLTLNVMEAVVSENAHGYVDNAMTGVALAVNPPETVQIVGENNILEYAYPQEWVSLYETWNLAFVTGNVGYLNILLPKLLIPSVINAKPNEYLFHRAMALQTSINFFLFAKVMQKPKYEIPNKEALVQLWGEINYKYANEYVQNKNGVDLSYFSYMLGTTMENIWDNLKMFLLGYQIITPEDAQMLSELLFGSN